ncbi:MAG: GGDEF domain-containing protein [Burkholderiaceae bacterium]|nr:GGDEF domain-containing protein [Burkholderiaceae bacterium]
MRNKIMAHISHVFRNDGIIARNAEAYFIILKYRLIFVFPMSSSNHMQLAASLAADASSIRNHRPDAQDSVLKASSPEFLLCMIDSLPVSCHIWSRHQLIDCNQTTLQLFDMPSKQAFIDNFFELSHSHQPNGSLSHEEALKMVSKAFETGSARFEWMHKKLDGELIPAEIIMTRIEYGDDYLVAAYLRDLRVLLNSLKDYDIIASYVHNLMASKEKEAQVQEEERYRQIMFDSLPICCNLWNRQLRNIDCNQEAVNLFGLSGKQEYIERFLELSPEYQPDGRLSQEIITETLARIFDTGIEERFEWMHQTLAGEPVPTEIALVRIPYDSDYVIAGYTIDLRKIKHTVAKLNKMEQLAFTDTLTGIFNRRYFMENAPKAIVQNYNPATTIMMLDLDHFKSINDTYGHMTGDHILKDVARVIQSVLRESDLLARYGGEEFIIMINDTSNRERVIRLAERICNRIRETAFEFGDDLINVTTSIGVAMQSDSSQTLEDLIEQADHALYQAKANGRNRVEFADMTQV